MHSCCFAPVCCLSTAAHNSSQYPDHTYGTLQKAMHQQKNSRNYLLTIDKVSTWNQGVIAYSFGTDTIIAYHDFELTEPLARTNVPETAPSWRNAAKK